MEHTIVASGRISRIAAHLQPNVNAALQHLQPTETAGEQKKDTLTVIDNRTGKRIEIPVQNNHTQSCTKDELDTIKATDLQKLNLRIYDPGYMNTASATSKITYIDGDRGILLYRGYPIEELAEKSTFLETAFLLINGELPSKPQLEQWSHRILTHTYIHENLIQLMQTFRYDAHPMGMLISSMAAISTFYPEANAALKGEGVYKNPTIRNKQIYRIIGKLPTIAACAYRHRIGRPYNQPAEHLGYTENFLYMLDKLQEPNYRPHPKLAHALDVLFMLHADHEMNCSTAAMRHISSSLADPYTAVAGAACALYGPLHGGATEAVLHMLEDIGSVENVPKFVEDVKAKTRKLMGFGHRVYKNYDPRARIIRRIAYEVFDVVGKENFIEIAVALEKHALQDEYFISRKLYPNVDFYSGLIYKAMGFPTDMFPVLFTIPRAVGWLAHWVEFLDDPENRIVRPRQVYVGSDTRHYVSVDQRSAGPYGTQQIYSSMFSKRRSVTDDAVTKSQQ